MKHLYLLVFIFFLTNTLFAQITETFETETGGATSFSDNGQVFNITSQQQGPFLIQDDYAGTGWGGSAADNKYIDNDGEAEFNQPVQFTISSAGGTDFRLTSMYLFLSTHTLDLNVSGTLTITGMRDGGVQFSASSSSGFNNGYASNNGFTFIDMATFGGQNNTSVNIDQFIISTTSGINYVALDGLTWQLPFTCTAITSTGSQTNVSCNGGADGTATVVATNGTAPYTYSWAPSGGTDSTATGLSAGSYTVTITDANGCTGTQSFTITQPSALMATGGFAFPVTCNGGSNGSATVFTAGGTPPYTYSWSPSGGSGATGTGLSAGIYTVTITDSKGCTATRNFTITQPPALTTTGVQTNVSCNGGSNGTATVTASGGTAPYTYSWMPSGGTGATATGLTAGTYTAVVTDSKGCTKTHNFTITQPDAPVAGSAVVTNAFCGVNGAINLTPSGGTPPYTFDWGGGITTEDRTGLTAGTYTVVITDSNGCTDTQNISVGSSASPSGTTVVTNVSCNGGANGAINLTPSGGMGPYTYSWNDGPVSQDRTGLAAGTYTVTITDANGCQATVASTVSEPVSAISGTTVVTNIACNGGTNGTINLTPSGGTGPYTYNWGGGITTEDRTGLAAGTYTVTITDANGCAGTVTAAITQPVSPVSGTTVVTNITCNGGTNGAINLTPTGGTGPYTYNWGGGITTEDRTGLAAGTYTVTITDANGCTGTVTATITQPVSPVSGTTVVTNIACSGGTNGAINLTPTGGTGPYTFDWGSGITTEDRTALSAGTYTVTITDANGCTGTVTATVMQPATPISGSMGVFNVSCFGGSNGLINLTPTGGIAPYTYSWTDGFTTEDRTGLSAGTYTVTITDANGCTGTVAATVTQPAAPVSGTVVVTNVACYGGYSGSINLTPTGGTPPYTYNWGSGITTQDRSGLPAGNYIVTITDNTGCTGTVNVTVAQPSAIVSGTTMVTNVSCNGGSNGTIDLTPSGGTPPYTYNWGGGITTEDRTGLSAGTYTVAIYDSNGCSGTATATIGEPAALVASASSQTNLTCNGGANGSATVAVTGGEGPYAYSWSPIGGTGATATGLSAGTYTVTVTDANGCNANQSFTITQPAALVASASSQTNISCNGSTNGSATVAVTGGTGPYTYLWSPMGGTGATATGLSAGTYTVTVADANGCTAAQSFVITEPASLVASALSQINVYCNGGTNGSATVAVTGGTGPYTYLWSPMGGTGATATGLSAGTYTVTVTDANGCSANQSFTITEPAALVASAASQTNVTCGGGADGSATVVATGGTGAYTYLWSPMGGTGATATGLSAGTYTVTVTDTNGCNANQSFTITEPAALVASAASQTNVTCAGGADGFATVAVTGGTGSYTYMWSPIGGTAATASGLSAGTYTVTASDANGCTATQSFTITEPAPLTATITVTDEGCLSLSDGTVTVNITGGTAPYSTSLDNLTFNNGQLLYDNLAAGSYSMYVKDANNCSISAINFTISAGVDLQAVVDVVDNCTGNVPGNTVTVSVNPALAADVTYSLDGVAFTASNTFTNLAPGTYTAYSKHINGCIEATAFTVNSLQPISATASVTSNISCNGGSNGEITVTATGGTGGLQYAISPAFTFSSSNLFTGLSAGTYTVIVQDALGCQLQITNIVITEPVALTATVTSANVSCTGTDGSATVTVTGGTGVYTYAWAPVGGTAATATGLAAGTYTVTVTDANGCTVVESVDVLPAADITAPIADVASLPSITSYCTISAADITIPTATDNCSGTITATTTDALDFTSEGTYTITWNYDDGNGNISSQTQTVNVLASPLAAVTFNDAAVVYNGTVQTIEVGNIPAEAAVDYTITPETGAGNGAVNAGVYTITATVTPPAEASACNPVILTALLTIEKAPQIIIFDPIPVKSLEFDPDFQLDAVATSGLPVYYTYTYTSAQPPASVTPEGFVDMLASGEVMVTAHQDGNENYLPAESVSQLLLIQSSNASIADITIGSQVYDNPSGEIYHVMDCADNTENVEVNIMTEANATVVPGHQFIVETPVPGIYTQDVIVTSQDGTVVNTYTITIEKRFNFFDIVEQKFDNVLLVNNNPATNGGYEFIAYEWYRNNELISEDDYYSAGINITDLLDNTAEYYVKVTTASGEVLQTCIGQIELEHNYMSRLYPNPAVAGRSITVEADFPEHELKQMQISVYSLTGKLITTLRSSTAVTQVQLPATIEDATYIVLLETPNIKETLKVIVKK